MKKKYNINMLDLEFKLLKSIFFAYMSSLQKGYFSELRGVCAVEKRSLLPVNEHLRQADNEVITEKNLFAEGSYMSSL